MPLEPLPQGEQSSHGVDRLALLKQAQRELSAQGVATHIGGPEADWDLQSSVGPFVAVRLNAAVRWEWFPMLRRRLRPRGGLLLALAVIAGVAVLSMTAAVVMATATAVVLGYELVRLTRVTGRVRQRLTEPPA